MGKKYAPALANLYLLDFDRAAMRGLQIGSKFIKPLLYKRYLDDVFFLWPGTTEELKLFENYLGNITTGIKITFEYNNMEISFLDTMVYKIQEADGLKLKTKVQIPINCCTRALFTLSTLPVEF